MFLSPLEIICKSSLTLGIALSVQLFLLLFSGCVRERILYLDGFIEILLNKPSETSRKVAKNNEVNSLVVLSEILKDASFRLFQWQNAAHMLRFALTQFNAAVNPSKFSYTDNTVHSHSQVKRHSWFEQAGSISTQVESTACL